MAKRKNNASASKANGATVGYEAQLWQMADALRGSMDAAEYKHVVLGLIFLKYISEAFEEQHAIQEQVKDLEKQKRRQRQRIFDVEDEIMAKRDSLIEKLEKRMRQRTRVEPLFTIRWTVV